MFRDGKVEVVAPYTSLSGTADYRGQQVSRDINGFADPSFRLSVNLYGAPALTLKEFKDYEQDVIVGASLQVSVPWGQYDDSRLVNIGTNRWSIKPEVGVSKALGRWTLELSAAATLYTDNNDLYGGNQRSQDPIYSTQVHAIYSFRSGVWASVDATWFMGGRTTVNGVLNSECRRAQDAKRDVQVALSPSARRQLLGPGTPRSGVTASPRHAPYGALPRLAMTPARMA